MAANGQYLKIAREYSSAGLSPIAVRVDGSKAPIEKGWQSIRADDAYLVRLFDDRERAAIGILCGDASDGLEVLDIDRAELYELVVEAIEQEAPGLVERIPVVRTGSGAYHLYYRHPVRNESGNPPGGTKLARRETVDQNTGEVKRETLVETRGHGHQVVAPGSHVDVHPAKRPYEHIAGPPLIETPSITADERAIILKAARSFDQMPAEEVAEADGGQLALEPPPEDSNRPGDAFNRNGPKWSEILEPAGWVFVKKCGKAERWRRPGKEDDGWSATTNYDGHNHFTVFSENADPFKVWADPPKCERRKHYTQFAVYTMLYHDGNWGAASDCLEMKGYGTKEDDDDDDFPTYPCLEGERVATKAERKADQEQFGDKLRALKESPNGDSKAGEKQSTTLEWDAPMPLDAPAVSPFPIDVLGDMGGYIAAVADSLQVSADMPAMMAMTMFAVALAKKVVVQCHVHQEPANIYTVIVAASGERKSAVYRELIRPIQQFEREENERLAPEIAKYEIKRKILAKRLEQAEKTAAKAEHEKQQAAEERAEDLAIQLLALEAQAVRPLRLIVGGDCTPEALASVMAKQGGRLGLVDTEGGLIGMMKGRYSAKGDINVDTILKAYSGDDIIVDRVSKDRPSEHIIDPALTLGMFCQPEVIRGLVSEPHLRGVGLLARLWFAMPESSVGYRAIKPTPIPADMRAGYDKVLLKALEFEPASDEKGEPTPHVLKMDADAMELWSQFAERVEKALRPDGELAHIADWGAKIAGGSARIAGILHCIRYVADTMPAVVLIDAKTMGAAITIAAYLIEHAKAAFFEMGSDPDVELARRILAWVKREGLSKFTKRNAHYRLKNSVEKADDMDGPLRILEEAGYIRDVTKSPGTKGGRTSKSFAVNPAVVVR